MSTQSRVREVFVGEHIQTMPRKHKIKRSEYLVTGRVPVVDQGQEFIAGHIDDEGRAYEGPLPVIVFGDHTCTLKYVDFSFPVGADGTQLICPTSDFDIRYFYYCLRSLSLEHFGYQRHFKYLKEKRILWRPMDDQRKIAAILSAYDDLIGNNLRRIKILEEIAQLIYREWFVNFRFPGHGNVKVVDSELGMIPEGWEVKEMRELAHVIDCLHSKKPEAIGKGYGLLLQLFNIGDGGKIDLSKKYLISESDYRLWTSRIEVQSGDCVITNVGRIAAVAQIPEGVKAALGRNMTSVRAKPMKMTPTFLIEYLLSPHMENEVLKKRDSGTIMDSLNVKGIIRLLVPVPPLKLMTSFEAGARRIRRRIEVLVGQNSNLRQTRDLLLPKLISGDVDVSDLDIKTGDDK